MTLLVTQYDIVTGRHVCMTVWEDFHLSDASLALHVICMIRQSSLQEKQNSQVVVDITGFQLEGKIH